MSRDWDALHKDHGHLPARYISGRTYPCDRCGKPSWPVVVLAGRQYWQYCLPRVEAGQEEKERDK